MLGEELRPGLRAWTTFHAEWEKEVRCFAIVEDERLTPHGALIAGDVLLGDGEAGEEGEASEGLHLCPDSWVPGDGGAARLGSARRCATCSSCRSSSSSRPMAP